MAGAFHILVPWDSQVALAEEGNPAWAFVPDLVVGHGTEDARVGALASEGPFLQSRYIRTIQGWKVLTQTYPKEAFRLAEGPFVGRTLGQGEVHRWTGIPGLVAVLDVVGVRCCVAAVVDPGVVWGRLALTQGQDRGQDRA